MTLEKLVRSLQSVFSSQADPSSAVERLLREYDESRDCECLKEIRRLKDKIRELKAKTHG